MEGFELAVTDYLVKPVPLERFMKACNRAKQLFESNANKSQTQPQADYFFLNADYSQVKIIFVDITWI